MSTPVEEVMVAAAALVAAFGRHDTEAYFAAFAPEATFVFYTAEAPLGSRAAYAELWASWELQDGFRVLSCDSTDRQAQVITDDVVVFSHRVATRVSTSEGEAALDERETIVFARNEDGSWLAVHEHLSPVPVV
jgi:ketosteroid isomerase-like protein